jgi:hypothetical protein
LLCSHFHKIVGGLLPVGDGLEYLCGVYTFLDLVLVLCNVEKGMFFRASNKLLLLFLDTFYLRIVAFLVSAKLTIPKPKREIVVVLFLRRHVRFRPSR